ncbi:EAL domain-containing protein [Sulfurimonas sp. C5]|nr:EAL domain-containing protein [Sulfurimonas sp. C5]MDH4945019.1 EAL domain-containing protein [Sulfurimonas sp. C5]
MSRDEWREFIKVLDIAKNYPGMQGIGYAQMLSPAQVPIIERKMRDEGFSSFIVKPKGEREQYSAILFLEPLDIRNKEAIGYDMFSESTRREAMEKARDTGKASMSGRVTLVQEIDEDVQAGMLIYLPLYQKKAKIDTVEERRKALLGYVYSPYRMDNLMEHIVHDNALVGFDIYDTEKKTPEHLLYSSLNTQSYPSLYRSNKKLKINGRIWYINFYSTPEYEKLHSMVTPLMTTSGVLFVIMLLLMIITFLIKNRIVILEQSQTLNKLTQALEQSPNSTVITDINGVIEYVNDAFVSTTGYSKDEAFGKPPSILKSGKTADETYRTMWKTITAGKEWQGEFINKRKDGSEYIEFIKILPVFASDGSISNYMAVKEDITEKKQTEERIYYLANFDTLTGLANRYQLMERLGYMISSAKRNNEQLAVIFLDLDQFKNINDTLGHSVGDLLLTKISERIISVLREIDTVARLGGDEFMLILPDTNAVGASNVSQKVLSIIEQPIQIRNNELIVSASIGIAIYPDDGRDKETLIKNADAAMYKAKQFGRNQYAFFTKEMQQQSVRNLQLTNELHYAIERKQFYLVYQPQINIQNNTLIGAEALLRWKHPELGEISPAEFIPLAEDSGMILAIGEWVLRQAIMQTKIWNEQNDILITMAVNISAVQFRLPNLPKMVIEVLEEIGLDPSYLELELTEGIAMQNPEYAIHTISKLDEYGIKMAIDDFGTGYSSLSYLKKFKISKLKIDQGFIRDICTDPDDRAIVSATISLAKSLGLKTIAEGVETEEQLNYIKMQQCDMVQGYFFSKPLRVEEFQAYIFSRSS